jgi:hypothetical protein
MPAAISACGTAPVASSSQRQRISRVAWPCARRAPTTTPCTSSGATKRTGACMRAPARTAARQTMSSSSRRGSTASVPGTSTRPPRDATRPACVTGCACAITSSSTPRRRSARCASGIRPSPQTLSRGMAWWSTTTTSRPARASVIAAALPAGPAPTTSTSQRVGRSSMPRFMRQAQRRGRGF